MIQAGLAEWKELEEKSIYSEIKKENIIGSDWRKSTF